MSSQQTFIPGKDESLEHSIARLEQRIKDLGFSVEQKSWLNPVPHVYSVHLQETHCPQLFSNGKGASEKAALASALGEFLERLATNYFFSDFWWIGEAKTRGWSHYPQEKWIAPGSAFRSECLSKNLWDWYEAECDLEAEHLLDYNAAQGQQGICCLPFYPAGDRAAQPVYFPVNLLANLYASNGLSAGNTASEARVQGLSEVFERFAKAQIIAQRLCLPDIPESLLAQWPHVREAKEILESQGYRLVLKDASMGGRYPVICVTLVDVAAGTCLASFGAHPQFSVALERTLTELFQGRSLQNLDGFRPASLDADYVASAENIETHFIDSAGLIHVDFFGQTPDFEFVAWDFSGTTAEEFDRLVAMVQAEGREVYIADYAHLGFYACRIVVPGMSEIYAPDELTWHNRNEARVVRDYLVNLADLSDQEGEALWAEMASLSVADHHRVAEWLGLLQDKDSPWKDMRFGEFKAYLACYFGELEEALDWLAWCEDFGQIPPQRMNLLRSLALQVSAQLDANEDYLSTAGLLYGETAYQHGEHLLSGSWIWPSLTGSKAHEKLMVAKDKLMAHKQAYFDGGAHV